MTENKTYLYLSERFKATKWRYHSLNKTKHIVGESFNADIKELRDKGMVQPTAGINGWLVELIGDW